VYSVETALRVIGVDFSGMANFIKKEF